MPTVKKLNKEASVYDIEVDYYHCFRLGNGVLVHNSSTCQVRSNKQYNAHTKDPIGHDLPWDGGPGVIHWNCRSVGIPINNEGVIVEGSGAGNQFDAGTKTAIGAERGYQRGDLTKEDGSKYKIPTRDNNLKKDPVSADTDYATWLRKQPKAFVQDVLGVEKTELFFQQTKNFTLEGIVTDRFGSPIRLSDVGT